ncbi:MAG: AAA family ATPase [Dorea sp.]
MLKIAVYGKGGIGKSTTVSNMAVALVEKGLSVMQIGCDPKADSTIALRDGEPMPAVLDIYNEKKGNVTLKEITRIGYKGVVCVESGGPTPGLGCAGRGIITALEKLKETGAYEVYKPDVVLYDVLGDVVCGGFSMPMRSGYADYVFVVTSGENMSIHAGAEHCNGTGTLPESRICKTWRIYSEPESVPREEEKVQELAEDFHSGTIGYLSRSELVMTAEEQKKTLMECYPDSEMADEYRALSEAVLAICKN